MRRPGPIVETLVLAMFDARRDLGFRRLVGPKLVRDQDPSPLKTNKKINRESHDLRGHDKRPLFIVCLLSWRTGQPQIGDFSGEQVTSSMCYQNYARPDR